MENVLEELLHFLKENSIALTARIIVNYQMAADLGGVLRDITSKAWIQAERSCYFEGDREKVITSALIPEWICVSIGKLIFVCLAHGGAFPTFIHASLLDFIFEQKRQYKSIESVFPSTKNLTNLIQSVECNSNLPEQIPELRSWMIDHDIQPYFWKDMGKGQVLSTLSQYELIDRRTRNLSLIKAGFDQHSIVNEIVELGLQSTLATYLLQTVSTAKEFKNQIKPLTLTNKQDQTTFDHFMRYIEESPEVRLQQLMLFIVGSCRIPVPNKIGVDFMRSETKLWPVAHTCDPSIELWAFYREDDYETFERDLDGALRLGSDSFGIA
ncbi:uncharacterized protein LOC129586621 [Paramacrobiotus metropolitanus]|uniref:uncharacterized protein LOC129586621 n=1 Tax=Paramacrobiotus metropolitanus TaxID=2943436 RepID=UPI002445D174|nr:uncharacterized protein LOC129586621 [Paramacrobiotus metropolitanus]